MTGPGWSSEFTRRRVLGGIGAGASVGMLVTAPVMAGRSHDADRDVVRPAAAPPLPTSPLNPAWRYVLFCGHDFQPLQSPATYTTLDGQFRFTNPTSGYASIRPTLPLGSVIKELEVYGLRGATGVITLDLWKSTVTTGVVVLSAQATVPATAGAFTTTLACNDTQDAATRSIPFVNIDATAAPATYVYGLRVGYVSSTQAHDDVVDGQITTLSSQLGAVTAQIAALTAPPHAGSLVLIDPTRVYDSRLATQASGNAVGRIGGGVSRVVNVANGIDVYSGAVTVANLVPPGATAIVCNLTVSQAQDGGFLSLAAGDAATLTASTINWSPGTVDLANGAIVRLDAQRQVKVFSGGGGSVDFIIDVAGYYV